jgi:two-component system, NtrC family, nitrogen regulation sensor histidine kinase NtrY
MKKLLNANKWWLLGAAWVYTFTFVFNHYWSKSSSYPSIASSFSNRIEQRLQDFAAFCQDTLLVSRLARFQMEGSGNWLQSKDAFYYLYEDSPNGMQLRFWSHAGVVPRPDEVPYRDTVKLVPYRNGTYVMASYKLPNSLLTAVQLVLVKQAFYIENNNFRTAFPGYPDLEKHVDISQTSTPYQVVAPDGKVLFYLKALQSGTVLVFNWASLVVQLLATFLLLIFFYRVGLGLAQQRRLGWSFVWMVGAALLIRACITYIGFPINVSNISLFSLAGSGSWLAPSLGGLLLNLLLLVWFIYFIIRTRFAWLPPLAHQPLRTKRLLTIAGLGCLLPLTFLFTQLVVRLVQEPAISFDVADFFSLGWNTLWAIACLYFVCVLHYRVLHLSNELFSHLWPHVKWSKYAIVAGAGLLLLTLFVRSAEAAILLFSLLWLVISLLLEDKLPALLFFSMERPVRFVFWLIWYALAAAMLVQTQQQAKTLATERQLAYNIAQHANSRMVVSQLRQVLYNNPSLEELTTRPDIVEDSSYSTYLRRQMLQQLRNELGGEYDTKAYLFDTDGRPMYNTDSATYQTLNTLVEEQSETSPFPNIYLYESGMDRFGYLVRQPLVQDSAVAGYLFITSMPVSVKTQALAPELFKPLQDSALGTARYSYAVYQSGNLLYSTRNFPFTTAISPKKRLLSDYEVENRNGYSLLWHNADNRRLIVVVKSQGLFSELLTLFAYLFGCFIVVYLLESLVGRLLSGSYHLQPQFSFMPTSIRGKIRRTVIAVSMVSFILIGVVTVGFFRSRYQTATSNRLSELAMQVENDLKVYGNLEDLFSNASALPGDATAGSTISLLAELLTVDINLFDAGGNLLATSLPAVYDGAILSRKMNPTAYYQMAVRHLVQFQQTEMIGQLSYQGIYLPVRTTSGATIGFINVPYYASQVEVNQEISNFLVTLVNLIAFVAIIAGIIAFFITNSITSSFFIIGQKMNAISLGNANDPIMWNRNDEIGILVQQYNIMLQKLDESARKLASSEREYAWREMAKQVAHEIKNPLTPMKLNLQYLQRQINNGAPNAMQTANRMADTLVAQIDHLNQIASDFSQLARINVARVERFNIHDELRQIVTLYQMDSHFQLTWRCIEAPVLIDADRTQINRLFTNLIKNAGEAVPDSPAIITIQETLEAETVLVAITDNGPGIPEEMQAQLFRPNFTTKSSGTGLGLAICKDIAEGAGGSIWFQSGNDHPTTFFVRLPVVV